MFLVKMDVSFWRRKSKKGGKCTLYCRVTVAGQQMDICSTGLEIWKEHWDSDRVTRADPEAQFKNEFLDIMRNDVRAAYTTLYRSKEKITAAKLKRAYLDKTLTGAAPILTAFELYMADSRKDQERDLCKETLNVCDNVRKKLTNFLINEKATDLLLEDFDITWVKKFRRWMKSIPLDGGKVGHADSYIIKQTQTIKNVLIWAKLNKLSDTNPLEGLRIKGPEWDDPVYLTEEEFQKVREHKFDNKILQQTADVFVILCRSGVHYGDLVDLVRKHRKAIKKGLDGKPWIVKDRIKTEVKIQVPIFEEVNQIVDKYGGWEKLPIKSPQRFNDHLKMVAAKLGLHEELSSKAGRKTFTDWCFNTLLLSTDAVKVLLGRKSAKGLEVYGKPDERRVAAEMKKSKALNKRKRKSPGDNKGGNKSA
ncbi:phage integrase SAM-like domain-containing protein [Spirosoma sp. RP8]|uniref:Phage integrase SAM-like domain-containing protein n=1 Tax=Spirosoma liriopis TaxID=2937440 RepID=A0ABT0HGJ0_9BACT|nr:phage integrase SAM-like domain-containing protein [Spirosoma liriopis]MCK8490730.1 phage integrase SAM-like domain-containing protein [Spirosoma liriopis]